MDWYLPPKDKFEYETKFSQITNSEIATLQDLDPIFKQSMLPTDQFLLIFQLVNIRQDNELNKNQFIYLMHILNQRRRGSEIPTGIPLNIKQDFLATETTKVKPVHGNDLKSQKEKLEQKLEILKQDYELLKKVSEYECTMHYRREFDDGVEILRQINSALDRTNQFSTR